MTDLTSAEPSSQDRSLLVHAYVDGELDPANALATSRQIDSDPQLAAEFANVQALRKRLREHVRREPLPPHLRSRIDAAVGLRRTRPNPSWRALAASVILALAVGSGSMWAVLQQHAPSQIADAVVDSHMRALIASRPTDVASSDRHTVKPWFNGRIPYAPRVVELATAGFPLVGARIDVIGATPVASLVYGRRLHLISLAEIPAVAKATDVTARPSVNGFNVVNWSDGSVSYWAVSDLAVGELETFAKLFMSAPPTQ